MAYVQAPDKSFDAFLSVPNMAVGIYSDGEPNKTGLSLVSEKSADTQSFLRQVSADIKSGFKTPSVAQQAMNGTADIAHMQQGQAAKAQQSVQAQIAAKLSGPSGPAN